MGQGSAVAAAAAASGQGSGLSLANAAAAAAAAPDLAPGLDAVSDERPAGGQEGRLAAKGQERQSPVVSPLLGLGF